MPAFRDRPVDAVIDVRTRVEFFFGHLDGAENIPVDRLPHALEGRSDITTASRILVYCASGMRSAQAASMLKAAGFTRVVDGGGIGEARAGYGAE